MIIRQRRRRRKLTPDEVLEEGWQPHAACRQLAEGAQRRVYADGLRDGIETTLRLLTADRIHDVQGIAPCPGPIPLNVHRWARAALHRIEQSRA